MTAVGDLGHANLGYRGDETGATPGGATALNKLWLPVWSGEVIHAYDEVNQFEGLTTHKTIPSGRKMEFPITGTVNLKTAWAAGEELVGQEGSSATSTTFAVELDSRPMAAHFELDNVDLMITQWEYRAELARQAGLTLANARDKQLYAYLVRASVEAQRTNDPRPSMSLDNTCYADSKYTHLGSTSATASQRTDAALGVLQCIEDFVVHLQSNNIDTNNVYCCVSVQAFQDIRALGVARVVADNPGEMQPMFGGVAAAGGLGAAYTQGLNNLGDTLTYMGVTIMKSNHMLTTDAPSIGESRYSLDFAASEIKSVIWQAGAVASLRLQGLKVDTVDDIRRNTTFTVASMMGGTGVLAPERAAFITANASHNTRALMDTALGSNMVSEYTA